MSRHRVWFAVALLTASLWANACGDGATDPLRPEPSRPTTVTVSPATAQLTTLDATVQLTAEVRDQNGRAMSGATVTWASSSAAVATVDGSGLMTAVGNGTTMVTATSGEASGSATVTVEQRVAEVRVSPDSVTLFAIGDTVRLAAEALDSNGYEVANAEFAWSSADSVVAVDSSGLVTAVANGTTVVTATSGEASGSATVTVEQRVAEVRVSPDSVTLFAIGDTVRLAAEALDANGQAVVGTQSFAWSSDETVVTVDTAGLVTAVAEGSGKIMARLVGTGLVASATVLVDVVSQREALVALYNATHGDGWRKNQDWLTDAPLDSWYGVTTNGDGHVTEVLLSANGLTGVLPADLASLHAVEHLDLSSNSSLTGKVPSAFGKLEKLKTLELDWCDLSGPIPPELGSLTKLTRLDLSLNKLTGPVPPDLGNLTALEHLDLSWNRSLRGRIPDELANLAALEHLDLAVNELTGPIPRAFESLTNLGVLDLSSNSLSGSIPPGLGNLPSLTSLRLGSNELTGSIPSELGSLANLRELRLGTNELSGEIPRELASLAGLEELDLRENNLEGRIPPELGSLSRLAGLQLASNRLTGSIPLELKALTSLRFLYLGSNQLSGPIPPELGNLGNLNTLDLRRNALTGSIPGELGSLTKLNQLVLWQNALEGPLPPELGNLAGLAELDLSRNQLAGPLPPELGNLTSLKELSISSNPLAGPIPQEFVKLRLVKFNWFGTQLCSPPNPAFQEWVLSIPLSWASLTLEGIRRRTGVLCVREALAGFYAAAGGPNWTNNAGWLTEAPVSEWYGVTTAADGRVVTLDLQGNGLSGTISDELQALLDLNRLDFRGNRLGGGLPGEMGKLGALEELYLSDNELSGRIPTELGNLSSLKRLDLSLNRFAGALPGSMVRLEQLAEFLWNESGLCAPDAGWFQTWLRSIASHDPGATCSTPLLVSVPALHLTQANQSLTGDVPLIAGRAALLRVFPVADRASAHRPAARAAFFVDGREVHRAEMELASAEGIPEEVDPGSTDRSYYAVIPGDVLGPGIEMVVQIDPDSSMPRIAGSQFRVPAEGRLRLDVREMPVTRVTIVPILHRDAPDSSVFEWTSGMGPGHPAVEALANALPVNDLQVSVRDEAYVTTGNLAGLGLINLLNEITLLRTMEGGDGLYYGAIAGLSGTVGMARLSEPVGVGVPEPLTFVHELGHTMSLLHTPPIAGYDPDYPYPNHTIGVWGYDFRSDSLVPPSTRDVMAGGRNRPFWISDYNFNKALRYRLGIGGAHAPSDDSGPERTRRLLLWGGVTPEGELRLDPAFVLELPAKLPSESGPYRVEGFRSDGSREFSLRFAMDEIDHGGGGFLFAIPFEEDRLGSVERITLTGPEGTAGLNRDSERAMALVLDRVTGQLRSVLRGESAAGMAAMSEPVGPGVTGLQTRTLISYGLPAKVPN